VVAMKNIIIMDNRPYIRYRVKELIEKGEIVIHEASNSTHLFNKLRELNNDVDLLIIEINLKEEDGIEIIKNLRKKKIEIPFMVLTSLNTRDAFIKSVKAGAVDYFLKPFNGDDFVRRVIKHISNGQNLSIEDVKETYKEKKGVSSLNDYLAEKIGSALGNEGNISFIMFIVFKSEKDLTIDLHNDHEIYTNYAYDRIKSLTNEVDRFERYGSNAFIGIYPSYSQDRIIEINEEIIQRFDKLRAEDVILSDYYFGSVSATLPQDGKTYKEILEKLEERINKKIKTHQKKSS
jgi:DNA-binding response OmpR family regulator